MNEQFGVLSTWSIRMLTQDRSLKTFNIVDALQTTNIEDLYFHLVPGGMKLTVGDNDFKTGSKTALEQLTGNTPWPIIVRINVSAITSIAKNARLSALKTNVIRKHYF